MSDHPQRRHRTRTRRRTAMRQVARVAALRGCATAAGAAPIQLLIWWITHR
jgi:hypothetical protein